MDGSSMTTPPRVTEAIAILKGVFLEMPTTRLSLADATRLSGVEKQTCGIILEALEDTRFLTREQDGLFVRRSGSDHR
jgi:hypothetical protein